ncbi:MAG: ATP-binding protein [Bacteroidota bacterium]|nr:ATP-binding protein [Bacteroidota bacterium]
MRTYSDKKKVDNMGAIEPQLLSAFYSLPWGLSICYPVTNFANEIIDFSFLYVNQMFSSTVKVKKDDLQGRNLSEFVPGFEKSDLFNSCCKAFFEGKPQLFRSVKLKELLKNNSWEGYTNISISACRNGITLCFQDVSDHYLTLEQLERSNKELEQFAYSVSHDLQEPLRMISNFAKKISKQYEGKIDEKADQYIGFMIDAAKRMQHLINDLLQYARVTTSAQPLVQTDLNGIIDRVMSDLSLSIEEEKAQINYGKLPEINADPTQIQQLFQNLISNAIKFRREIDPAITIEAKKENSEWLFAVHDNGIGISPEYYDRIFIVFQRLHEREKYSGTGIGLAICKKIVERHGGRIWVESEKGRGSSFFFSIRE